MKLVTQLQNFLSVLTGKLENEKKSPTISRAYNHVGWCVQRYKDKQWKQFGRTYRSKEDAISALIDWNHMFVGEEFRVYEVVADTPKVAA